MMNKLTNIIKHNKLYTALFVFILAVNVLAFIAIRHERAERDEIEVVETEDPVDRPGSERRLMFDEGEIKARQAKLEELVAKKPLLGVFLASMNLIILYLIFFGLALDLYFLRSRILKRPILTRVIQQPVPRWGISDVVRVTLIFLSFSYIFVMLQGFLDKFFPVLGNDNFRMVFNTAVMNVAGIGVILYFIVGKYGQDISSIGLTLKRGTRNVLYGAVGYVALLPVFVAIMVLTFFVIKFLKYHPPVQPIVEIFIEEKNTSVLLFSAVFAAVFGPVAEEIFFRGFMYTAIRKRAGIFWGMAITAVVFSILHAHAVGFLPIVALSLLLTYLYEKTGSLVSSIVVHITHNLAMVFLVFIARYIGA